MMRKHKRTILRKQETKLEEHILWRDLKEGDAHAFETIYKKYVQVVYNYGRKITNDEELIQDCIQDLFTQIWKGRENLGNIISIRYYLYASLKRMIIRKRQQRAKYFVDEPFNQEFSMESAPSHEYELISQEGWHEQEKRLQAGLQALNQTQREAIVLKFYKNLSYQEVADKMSLNVTHVYKIISRGLKAMEQYAQKTILLILSLLFF